jgi:hypothetical protein
MVVEEVIVHEAKTLGVAVAAMTSISEVKMYDKDEDWHQ